MCGLPERSCSGAQRAPGSRAGWDAAWGRCGLSPAPGSAAEPPCPPLRSAGGSAGPAASADAAPVGACTWPGSCSTRPGWRTTTDWLFYEHSISGFPIPVEDEVSPSAVVRRFGGEFSGKEVSVKINDYFPTRSSLRKYVGAYASIKVLSNIAAPPYCKFYYDWSPINAAFCRKK